MELLNPYGLLNGKVVYVDDVPSGKGCGCLCTRCHTSLIARKGYQRVHHFAHESGCECLGAYESAVHLLCKEIIERRGGMRLPTPSQHLQNPFKSDIFVMFDHVEVEKLISNIRPDLIAYARQIPLIIEIYVWHKTGQRKIEIMRELGISAIEVSLTEFRYPERRPDRELEHKLIEEIDNKEWLFNRKTSKPPSQEQENETVIETQTPLNPRTKLNSEAYVYPDNYICRICKKYIGKNGWVEHDTATGTYVCRDCIGKTIIGKINI